MLENKYFYNSLTSKYYEEGSFLINPIRKFYLRGKHRNINKLVHSIYNKRKEIADFGCGMCCWNINKLPVYGIDINENILYLAKQEGYIADYKVADITNSGMPDNHYDIIIASEVLEHIRDYHSVIREIYKILRPEGKVIITVPCESFFSLWWMAFWFRVLIQGYLFRDQYFLKSMGHINHFDKRNITELFKKNNFHIEELRLYFGTIIFLVATK